MLQLRADTQPTHGASVRAGAHALRQQHFQQATVSPARAKKG
nr:MAG TPA: hypothetical protein [Caudoviricetes sp.]